MALVRLIASLCLSLHVLCGIAAAQDLSVDVSFAVEFIPVDGRADALCTVNKRGSDVLSAIVWRHNGTVIQPIPNRIIIDTDLVIGRSELEIDSVVLSDAGTYSCQAAFSIPNGESIITSATLRIATALVVTAAEEQDFLEGDIANLTCSAFSFPSPAIQWFRVDEDLNEIATLTGRVEAGDEDYGVYRIPDVERSDGGFYKCEGSYPFERMSVIIQVFVISFPEILTPPLINFEVMKGDNLTLECETASQRPPEYIWSFEGEELSNTSNVTVGEVTGQLNVTNVTFLNTGTYNCFAENNFGNDTQNSTVVVAGSPEILTGNDTVTFAGVGNRAALNCSFLGYPPPTIVWSKLSGGGNADNADDYDPVNLNARLSINTTNGSFLIAEVMGSDRGIYSCNISNVHGSDARFNLTLNVIEFPPDPSQLRVIAQDDRSVSLAWVYVELNTLPEYRRPERFVVEARLDDNPEYELLDQSFPPNHTAGILAQLVPGTQFEIRIRADNLAGFSEPSNSILYTSVATIPQFLFFNATPLDDGRNILLQWELEFDGGPDVVLFEVEFRDSKGNLLDTFELDIDAGSYLVENLEPVTTYSFSAVALNDIGPTAPITVEVTTTLAPPSKPTQPDIRERTIRSLTFSFTVENGSRPIEYFVLNITEVGTEDSVQLNFSVTDEDFVEDFSELVAEESEEMIGYSVIVRVRDELENQREYIFTVAAGSEIGLGEFSNSSDPFSLRDERLIYYIVAAVVGGVIVVVVVIIIVIAISCCVKRIRRRGRTMLITGKHTTMTTSTDFILKEPYNTNADFRGGNVDRTDTASPFYNKLSQYHNGGQSYGIDEPDTRFSTSPNSVPSSQLQNRLSGQSSTLPRTGTGSGPDSVVSDKHFPGSPPGTLRGQDPTLSYSTPAITDRYSSDIDTLQKSTSYMTDV